MTLLGGFDNTSITGKSGGEGTTPSPHGATAASASTPFSFSGTPNIPQPPMSSFSFSSFPLTMGGSGERRGLEVGSTGPGDGRSVGRRIANKGDDGRSTFKGGGGGLIPSGGGWKSGTDAITSWAGSSLSSRPLRPPPPPWTSVSLSCLSPDGRSVHSLSCQRDAASPASSDCYSIATHFLPIESTSLSTNDTQEAESKHMMNDGNEAKSLVIATPLPETITEALGIDPPLGLICVDNNDSSSSRKWRSMTTAGADGEGSPNNARKYLPLLCLYTTKSVFLLRITYTLTDAASSSSPSKSSSSLLHGHVIRVMEPFESYLLSAPPSTSIIKIRSAPQRHDAGGNYVTLCPPGSMAMLTDEYALVLFHGLSTKQEQQEEGDNDTMTTTTPLYFGIEELSDLNYYGNNVVDFCFYHPSSAYSAASVSTTMLHKTNWTLLRPGVSLFHSISVLLLRQSCEMNVVSPVIFDGTVLPKSMVRDAMTFLDDEIERLKHISTTSSSCTLEGARWRQCKAARQYLLDVFGSANVTGRGGGGGGYYATARVLPTSNTSTTRSANLWPVRLQGPILEPRHLYDDDDNEEEELGSKSNSAITIEPFNSGNDLIDGFVIGCVNNQVEYVIVPTSGSVTLPRFAFESDGDEMLLNDSVKGVAATVERVIFEPDNKGEEDEGSEEEEDYYNRGEGRKTIDSGNMTRVTLLRDPVNDNMIHYVSARGIFTVKTNVMSVMGRKVRRQVEDEEKKDDSIRQRQGGGSSRFRVPDDDTMLSPQQQQPTLAPLFGVTTSRGGRRKDEGSKKKEEETVTTNAWSSLEISGGKIDGAVVSGDAHFGHVLVARLSNGSIEAVNLTAAQYIHEASLLLEIGTAEEAPKPHFSEEKAEADEALKAMEATPPLHELVKPLIENVVSGLSAMGKIVGELTMPRDATPATLATVLSTKQKCETDIILPLQELHQVTSTRLRDNKIMYDHQVAQLKNLQEMIKVLKERMAVTTEKKSIADSNDAVLAQRSAAVLQASRDLLPTITQAEHEYFNQLKRYEVNCKKWEGEVQNVQNQSRSVCDAMDPGVAACTVELTSQQVELCNSLLKGENLLLKRGAERLKEMEGRFKAISVAAGLDGTSDAPLLLADGRDARDEKESRWQETQ